jgi:hypothetical protein
MSMRLDMLYTGRRRTAVALAALTLFSTSQESIAKPREILR